MGDADQDAAAEKNDGIILQQIIGKQLEDLGITGVFLASTGFAEQEASRIQALFGVTKTYLEVAQEFGFPETPRTGCPVVYNRTLWSSDKLCGYIGDGIEVSNTELLTSRRDMWLFALRYPEQFKNHFLKCALWFTQNHGNDYQAGLSLLLALFADGWFIKVTPFTETINSFARYYALDPDLSPLNGTTVSDTADINKALSSLTRQYEKVSINIDRFNEILGSAIDLVLDRVEQVYESQNLDDWIIGQTSLYGPALWLSFMFVSGDALGLSAPNMAMLSRFDEMSADVSASTMFRLKQAELELPPTFNLHGYEELAGTYREQFPGDWLDRLTEDRLIMPNAVRDIVRQADPATLDKVELGDKYSMPSPQIALPFCIAHGRYPALARSVDFSWDQMTSQLLAMGATKPVDESQIVAARRALLEQESILFATAVKELPRFSPRSFRDMFEMQKLYPWHPTLCLESAKLMPSPMDLGHAESYFNRSIALEPTNPDAWRAIARRAERRGFGADSAAFSKIATRMEGN